MWRASATRARSALRTALRSGSVRTIAGVLVHAFGATVLALLTARSLGPTDRGIIVVLLTALSLLVLIGTVGTGTGIRVQMAHPAGLSARSPARSGAALTFVQFAVAVALGLPLLVAAQSVPTTLIAGLFVAICLAQLIGVLQREYVHGLGRHAAAIMGDVLSVVVQLGIVGVAIAAGALTLTVAVVAMLIGALVEICYFVVLVRRVPNPSRREIGITRLWRLSLPALVSSLGQAVVVRGDRLVLGVLADPAVVGIYGMAATLAEAIWLIPLGISQIVLRRVGTDGVESVARLRRWAFVCMAASAAAVAFVAPPFVRRVLGPDFAGALPLTLALLLSAAAMSSYLIDAAILNGLGHLGVPSRIALIGAVVVVAGSFALIPWLSAWGAAVATLAGYGAMAAMARRAARRVIVAAPERAEMMSPAPDPAAR